MTTAPTGTKERRPLVVGNWKMNLGGREGLERARRLARRPTSGHDAGQLVVLPPFTVLPLLQQSSSDDEGRLEYGAQDVSAQDDGAFTGDVSASMLAELGCSWVLAGHSERRQHHAEDDSTINAKVRKALGAGLTPILCVGEGLDVRRAGDHVPHTLSQLEAGLAGLDAEDVARVVVAYEPVWAIGTGEVATPADAQEVCGAIRRRLAEQHGPDVADRVRLLYGGSVKAATSAAIVAQPDIDGALVGGASLDPDELTAIWRATHSTPGPLASGTSTTL